MEMRYSIRTYSNAEERKVVDWFDKHGVVWHICIDDKCTYNQITALLDEATWEIMKKELNLGIVEISSVIKNEEE